MIKYRPVNGSFNEAMLNVKEFNNDRELYDFISKGYLDIDWIVDKIKIKHVGHDVRNDWDTYYLLVSFRHDIDSFKVAGYINKNIYE